MSKMKVGVIFGGKSGEHEISCMSATSIINAIDKDKYDVKYIGITKEGRWLLYEGPVENITNGSWQEKAEADLAGDPEHFEFSILATGDRSLKDIIDFALPILHGPNGEDGTVQGLLELINIPYGGSGVVGCAATMDKIVAKRIFDDIGIKQTPYVAFTSDKIGSDIEKQINSTLKYPLFVKPANMGSSVGITKVHDKADLMDAIKLAAKYDDRLVVEQGVNAREFEIGVMGRTETFTGEIGEILSGEEFYSYDAKYFCDASETVVPAHIPDNTTDAIKKMAQAAYTACGCDSYARCDFLMDKETGEIFINEINSIPGFTNISMFPKSMMASGMTYPEIVEKIIELGLERYNVKNSR